MGGINAKQMRAWLERNPAGRLRELYIAFDEVDIRQINRIMDYLARKGELSLGDEYTYRPYLDSRLKAAQDKVWRAIRSEGKSRRIVEVDEIALLSGISRDYCRKYMRWLGQKGYLSRRKNGRYGVLDKAMKQSQTPYWAGPKHKKQGAGDGLDGRIEA